MRVMLTQACASLNAPGVVQRGSSLHVMHLITTDNVFVIYCMHAGIRVKIEGQLLIVMSLAAAAYRSAWAYP